MSYTLNSKGLFVSRRSLSSQSVIRMIFTPDSLQDSFLLEGRSYNTAFDQTDVNGYLKITSSGDFDNKYGGIIELTDLSTGEVVSSYEANKTYDLKITNLNSTTYINSIGNDLTYGNPFTGVIHSIKVDGCKIGYQVPSSSTGVDTDLHFQFDTLNSVESPPSRHWGDCNIQKVTETRCLGAVPNNSSGWNYDSSSDTWTSTADNWNRLYLYKSGTDSNGRRPYERLVRIQCEVELNGKGLKIFWDSPGQSNCNLDFVDGPNDVLIYERRNSGTADTRPKFDFNGNRGVKIKNLVVTESTGLLIQGVTWVNNLV